LLLRLPGKALVLRELIRRLGFRLAGVRIGLDLVVEMMSAIRSRCWRMCCRASGHTTSSSHSNALRRVSTLVLVGERDAITPPRYSQRIASRCPG